MNGAGGAPIRRKFRKVAHHQTFDVRPPGFHVVGIGPYITNVRISEAGNLAGVAGIGKYFLIAGEAGIENDFAATPDACAAGAAVKDSSVFERERRANCGRVRQRFLPWSSLHVVKRRRNGAELRHRPIREHGFAIN